VSEREGISRLSGGLSACIVLDSTHTSVGDMGI